MFCSNFRVCLILLVFIFLLRRFPFGFYSFVILKWGCFLLLRFQWLKKNFFLVKAEFMAAWSFWYSLTTNYWCIRFNYAPTLLNFLSSLHAGGIKAFFIKATTVKTANFWQKKAQIWVSGRIWCHSFCSDFEPHDWVLFKVSPGFWMVRWVRSSWLEFW